MLGHYEFKMLPYTDQAKYIWDKGTYLTCCREGENYLNLYHLSSFFA